MGQEIELKYRIRGGTDPIRIFCHENVAKCRKKLHNHDFVTVYVDTIDGEAKKSGVTIRGRIEDGDYILYAKTTKYAEGAYSERGEWRIHSDDLPNAAKLLAGRGAPTRHLIGKTLYVTGMVSFHRMECRVIPEPGFEYILSYDKGKFANHYRFEEVELELREGTPEQLIEVGKMFEETLGFMPQKESKHQRALYYTNLYNRMTYLEKMEAEQKAKGESDEVSGGKI